MKLALPVPAKDDWNAMTALEARGRELVEQLARFLTRETSAFEGARLSRTASQVGIRVGNRVRGLSTLTEQDVLHCNKFSDGVACGAWPTEVWSEGRRPEIGLLPEGEHYEIPVGCLIVEGLGNVFAAGRCISAEPRALASARVIGTALATGWAAGTVAARRAGTVPPRGWYTSAPGTGSMAWTTSYFRSATSACTSAMKCLSRVTGNPPLRPRGRTSTPSALYERV